MKSDYLDHYASFDPYTPVVAGATRNLVWLSQGVPASVLRRNEWYNDFVDKNGIADILGLRLFDSGSHAVMLGVHRDKGRAGSSSKYEALLRRLINPLEKAAELHLRLRAIGWKSAAAITALDHLSAAVQCGLGFDARRRLATLSARAGEEPLGRYDRWCRRHRPRQGLRSKDRDVSGAVQHRSKIALPSA